MFTFQDWERECITVHHELMSLFLGKNFGEGGSIVIGLLPPYGPRRDGDPKTARLSKIE